jgi:hypothetical protein
LGVLFSVSPTAVEPDPEQLVVETTHAGRREARLIWGLLSWMVEFGDLINTSRLIQRVGQADSAVLGALCTLALKHGADAKLKGLLAKCRVKSEPEVLFEAMAAMQTTARNERENAVPEFTRWGLHCSAYRIMEGGLQTRKRVLDGNRLLALRAVFGANIRADLLYWLAFHPKASIREAAAKTGFSYQPVYAELNRMVENKIADCETYGRVRVISLSAAGSKFIQALPV